MLYQSFLVCLPTRYVLALHSTVFFHNKKRGPVFALQFCVLLNAIPELLIGLPVLPGFLSPHLPLRGNVTFFYFSQKSCCEKCRRQFRFVPSSMNSGGKGGKGLGFGGGCKGRRRILRHVPSKRPKQPYNRTNTVYIDPRKGEIRRIARRGGTSRMSGMIYEDVGRVLKVFLELVIHDAVRYCGKSLLFLFLFGFLILPSSTENEGRKTVWLSDVLYALKRRGRTLYF